VFGRVSLGENAAASRRETYMLVRRWIALEVTSDCRNIGDFLEAPDKMHLICLEIGSANEPINIIDIHANIESLLMSIAHTIYDGIGGFRLSLTVLLPARC
jgi:hypothetical protein